MKTNHVGLVIDNSASMQSVAGPARRAINAIIDELRTSAEKTGQDTRVTLMLFGDSVGRPQFYNADASMLKQFEHYHPDASGTALWDAVGSATQWLQRGAIPGDDNAFLLIVVTDGQDNCSIQYPSRNPVHLQHLIKQLNSTDRWTFTFQVPPGGTRAITERLGVPEGNVREWEQSARGTEEVATYARSGLVSYFATRSAGGTKMDNFYRKTDLTGVSHRDLARNLDDLSGRFKIIKVAEKDDGAAIRPFVELKAKMLSYVTGCAFYQLTKTEDVQPQKAVLIMPKGTDKIYGGQQARDMIGIGQGSTVKVTPGDHAGFDVFVQSTSINRKLVGGTRVLVDTALTKGMKPTWDHNAVGIR